MLGFVIALLSGSAVVVAHSLAALVPTSLTVRPFVRSEMLFSSNISLCGIDYATKTHQYCRPNTGVASFGETRSLFKLMFLLPRWLLQFSSVLFALSKAHEIVLNVGTRVLLLLAPACDVTFQLPSS